MNSNNDLEKVHWKRKKYTCIFITPCSSLMIVMITRTVRPTSPWTNRHAVNNHYFINIPHWYQSERFKGFFSVDSHQTWVGLSESLIYCRHRNDIYFKQDQRDIVLNIKQRDNQLILTFLLGMRSYPTYCKRSNSPLFYLTLWLYVLTMSALFHNNQFRIAGGWGSF